ncbi:MAG: PQQ-binding-like beta-propeller repeat protein, partial [Planctomycetales bacterium]|nr:PQQ-binding-like beta-propeller repeat protein [Planctomycetales bacterium]
MKIGSKIVFRLSAASTCCRVPLAAILVCAISCAGWLSGHASDWPTWRGNAQRTGCVADAINTDLHLQWSRQLPHASPAWPIEQDKLRFDDASNPVVVGQRIFVNSSSHDLVAAYSTRSGEELWTFQANGPVRFAPVATQKRVYFVSDDGFLYCVSADAGELLWKKRGGPSDRLILGNDRLISSWPARGGPVLCDGTVYFGASIWPFMGIFLHAVNAESGETIWTNSGNGMDFTVQPHGASSFASVVPQGHVVIEGDSLIVPGGRSVPAVYDRHTGKLIHFDYVKKRGGHNVFVAGDQYVVDGDVYKRENGEQLDTIDAELFDGENFLSFEGETIRGHSQQVKRIETTKKSKLGLKKETKVTFEREKAWSYDVGRGLDRLFAKTGNLVWAARKNRVYVYDVTANNDDHVWYYKFNSDVWDILFADNRVFVVTRDNQLHCFGAEQVEPHAWKLESPVSDHDHDTFDEDYIDRITDGIDSSGGYALVLGAKSGRLIRGLTEFTGLRVVVLPSPKDDVRELRTQLMNAGLYGDRVAVLSKETTPNSLPPYFASLICSEYRDLKAAQALRLYDCLRPFGGRMVFEGDAQHQSHMREAVAEFRDPQIEFVAADGLSTIARSGPLPNTDDWTHQYANAAQSGISREGAIKAPFGLLWFGGPSHEGILPRHGHGPSPQVAGGRLIIEGPDLLRAVDIYTGRLLWEISLPELGKFYDNTNHIPGAGEIGGNYVTLHDRVYVVYGDSILELDATNGEKLREYKSPPDTDNKPVNWGHLSVEGDYLIASSDPVEVVSADADKKKEEDELPAQDVIAKGAQWRYLVGGEPDNEWNVSDFDDSEWGLGSAGFGYGDDDDATELDMKGKFTRVYLRAKFDKKQVANAKKLRLKCKYDDAFVAYLNGAEIARKHVKHENGEAKVEGHEADKYDDFEIKDWEHLLTPGENVLAIEGHNISKDSSDFSLDPYLVMVPLKEGEVVEVVKLGELLVPTRYSSGSRRVNVFDRTTGEPLWYRDAEYNFRHNAICAANGMLFCTDMLSVEKRRALERRGLSIKHNAMLYAFNLQTGDIVWSTNENVFGTFLNFSAEHDVLVQGGSLYRDRAYDEIGKGISAFAGSTGKPLWSEMELSYNGPVLLWRDKIITNGTSCFALDLLTGKKTGWEYKRDYGCNTAVGCQNFLTFR